MVQNAYTGGFFKTGTFQIVIRLPLKVFTLFSRKNYWPARQYTYRPAESETLQHLELLQQRGGRCSECTGAAGTYPTGTAATRFPL